MPPGIGPNSWPTVLSKFSASFDRSSIAPMKMKKGIASSTSLLISPRMRT